MIAQKIDTSLGNMRDETELRRGADKAVMQQAIEKAEARIMKLVSKTLKRGREKVQERDFGGN